MGSVTWGILFCLSCSGKHRSLGVSVSRVRSIAMDSWNHSQILSMLEGGNHQLSKFFMRHSLGAPEQNNSSITVENPRSKSRTAIRKEDDIVMNRYKTNAAKFYRQNLSKHIDRVKKSGDYKGREAWRRRWGYVTLGIYTDDFKQLL